MLGWAIGILFPAAYEFVQVAGNSLFDQGVSGMRHDAYSDSQPITNQASGEYMAKHPRMIQYLDKVQGLLKVFPTFTIQQVLRAENTHADALASLGSALDTQFRCFIPVEHLDRPSIEEIEPIDSMQIDDDPSWQDPIIDYLVNGNLPTDKSKQGRSNRKQRDITCKATSSFADHTPALI
ncbi:hypothetical protein L3X38_025039 [Prunus dulcis]|uniref:RNase H type-1 domain-containing protein n=1 Tax=Prunus dulcis TaxID=3755 RepID=A0AAD4W3G6_PRUDU|nr:hypothetical protein L3X38_025039 [Prunus dulcis]